MRSSPASSALRLKPTFLQSTSVMGY
jgi:hypothetical protein